MQLREQLFAEHNRLIQELESRYTNYIAHLLEQKGMIHQKIQSSFYQEINAILFKSVQSNQNTNPSTRTYNQDLLLNEFHPSYRAESLPLTSTADKTQNTNTSNALSTHNDDDTSIPNPPKSDSSPPQHSHSKMDEFIFGFDSIDILESNWTCITCNKKCRDGDEFVSHIKTCFCELIVPKQSVSNPSIHDTIHNESNTNISHKLPALSMSMNIENTTIPITQRHKAEWFKQEGDALLKQKKYKEAIIQYNKAIELDASNAVYFSKRAAAYTGSRNYTQAATDAHRACDIDPTYVKAYIREGLAQFKSKQYRKAYIAYSNALNKMNASDTNHRKYKEIQNQITCCITNMNANINHRRSRTDGLPFRCTQCHRSFEQKQTLAQHMMQHNGLNPFVCTCCRKPWKTKQNLMKHLANGGNSEVRIGRMRSKKVESAYECEGCRRTFDEWSQLQKHMSVNTMCTQLYMANSM